MNGDRMGARDMNTIGARATIPDYWFDKNATDSPEFWYLPGDMPIQSELEEAYIRLLYVYVGLMELPEARLELQLSESAFTSVIGPRFNAWAKRLKFEKDKLRWWHIGVRDAPLVGDISKPSENGIAEFMNAAKAFRPWAKKWALGSERMVAVVAASSLVRHVTSSVGVPWRYVARHPKSVVSKSLLDFVCVDTENPQLWTVLLSPERQRAEKAMRNLARHELSFYGKGERTLLHHAHLYIAVRVLGCTEQEAVPGWEIGNISNTIIKPFDNALEVARRRGRPFGRGTKLNNRKATDRIVDFLSSP